MIPYARQSIDASDIHAVVEVLQSDWLTQGPVGPRFEQAIADACRARHAVAVNSASAALHLACLALGVGPGDWVWTTPNTFVATANAALHCGARVDFVDIDAHTFNLSVDALAAKLENAERQGRLPKVVIPVHFAGLPCDMAVIHALAQRYGFRVIEDAAHAIGAQYQGEPVGQGRYRDITVFSFHPVKIVTTGEGGMALSNDDRLAQSLRLLRSHGVTRDHALFDGEAQGAWDYQQIALGYNLRLSDLQAALGHSQLQRLPEFLARRRALAQRYDQLLAGLPLRSQKQAGDRLSAWHLYPIRLDDELDREQVFNRLRAAGVNVNVHYIPVHRQPYYRKLGFNLGDFPQAESYYAQALSLPMYHGLSDEQQDQVAAALREALS